VKREEAGGGRGLARAALAVAAAVAVVLVAAAPGALAAHTPRPPKATVPAHSAPPPPAVPTATPGMPTTFAGCQGSRPARAARKLRGVPWAQQALDFSSAWKITRGQGVTVAVVDSGVQYTPQLAGRVSYYDVTGTGPADCVGHGTAVASIIAASDELDKGIPFYGVAPAARILSIKVNTGESENNLSLLPKGIRDAVNLGAQVINVSVQGPSTPALHQAIDYALSKNRVVVAAAGNDTAYNGSVLLGPFYPGAYNGVLSVGAVDQSGEVTAFTPSKTPIGVVAPGENIESDFPGGFSEQDNGTSFAAPFVSGLAALIRSAFPKMSAAQVVSRIIATADGHIGARSGAGMINPVQALTGLLPPQAATPSANPQPVAIPPVPHGNSLTRLVAVSVTGGAIAGAVLVVIVAMTVPHGRRRRWRPGRVDLRALGAKTDETGSVWGDDLPATDQEIQARSAPGPAAQAGPRSLSPG
jgi:membrane-anchored mycosin MYCP